MATANALSEALGVDELRDRWLERLAALIEQVDGWAKEMDWSTRRIEKIMDDSEAGNYKAPALLLQKETVRIILDPIGRASPGTEGIVDFYLMPAYDDIATLFWVKGEWLVRFVFPGSPTVVKNLRDSLRPFDKPTFEAILGEMMKNAQ